MPAPRELFEETNVVLLDHIDQTPVYSAVCNGPVVYNCTVFRIKDFPNAIAWIDRVKCDETAEGKVEWRTWQDLLHHGCSFREFNSNLLERLNRLEGIGHDHC